VREQSGHRFAQGAAEQWMIVRNHQTVEGRLAQTDASRNDARAGRRPGDA
jgi:hypothetical protein